MIKGNYFFFYYSQKDAWRDVTFSEQCLIDEASHLPEMITDHNLELWTVQSFQNLSLFLCFHPAKSPDRTEGWQKLKQHFLVYI